MAQRRVPQTTPQKEKLTSTQVGGQIAPGTDGFWFRAADVADANENSGLYNPNDNQTMMQTRATLTSSTMLFDTTWGGRNLTLSVASGYYPQANMKMNFTISNATAGGPYNVVLYNNFDELGLGLSREPYGLERGAPVMFSFSTTLPTASGATTGFSITGSPIAPTFATRYTGTATNTYNFVAERGASVKAGLRIETPGGSPASVSIYRVRIQPYVYQYEPFISETITTRKYR